MNSRLPYYNHAIVSHEILFADWPAMKLDLLNTLSQAEFVAHLGAVFEHSPWVAERAWARRPFADAPALHGAMVSVVREAEEFEQLTLIRAHPELAGREAVEGGLTVDSSTEQGRLGFTALSREEFQTMQDINLRYREKFGFPCIVALRLHATRDSVMQTMLRAIDSERSTEIERALDQIGEITRGRLDKMIGGH
ncbi:MAG: 2-oxo-4-hydroxy-4-carboxy-5-ureidoimidazoline decarboxylase [Burkholderiales bacterium]